jgi:hypothetical protein
MKQHLRLVFLVLTFSVKCKFNLEMIWIISFLSFLIATYCLFECMAFFL